MQVDMEGGVFMERSVKKGLVLLALAFAVVTVLGLEESLAQQTSTFEGSVAGITTGAFAKGIITVKGVKGEVMTFAVGRKTVYVPSRYPGVGEWVKITYALIRGQNAAYQVEILPAPSSPPTKKK
jgi:hypothetical protein